MAKLTRMIAMGISCKNHDVCLQLRVDVVCVFCV